MDDRAPPARTEYLYLGLWQVVGALLVLAVVVASLMPPPPIDLSEGRDKGVHFLSYGTLMFWWSMLVRGHLSRAGLAVWFCVMGVVLEVLQGMTGYRSYDLEDMLANAIGVSIGWALGYTPLSRALSVLESRLH
jgi:VanZ family protein